jgi:MOSC domain-containing protein YiiM
MARLLSVNVGLPRDIAWQAKTVHTAVWKAPVQGRRMARRLNIEGDGQGDLTGHGGEHRAVFVYQIASYRYWQDQLGRSDFDYGQFGENFTVDGLPDDEVCIGDYYRIGDAVFEVTQPRVTCYRVGIRMNEPQMAALLVAHGRPGFYFRVLEAGEVEAGDEIVQVAAGPEHMTVAEVNALLYMPGHPKGELEKALRIPALSAGWRGSFQALLEREQSGSPMTGNPGLSPAAGPPPAWAGFRPLRVSHKNRESSTVTSLMLESTDERPLQAALPVYRAAAKAGTRLARSAAQLFAVGRAQRRSLSDQRQAGNACRGRGLHRRGSPGRRRARGERATRQLHAGAGRRPRRPAECGHRRDPGARDASRVGSGGVTARDLVDLRRPKRRRASVCGRDARPA